MHLYTVFLNTRSKLDITIHNSYFPTNKRKCVNSKLRKILNNEENMTIKLYRQLLSESMFSAYNQQNRLDLRKFTAEFISFCVLV